MREQTGLAGFVEYEKVESDYLEKRQLRKGEVGWVLLASLGVSYVISGDFAGWNFGLSAGGFGGMLIATFVMATMYTSLVFTLAELSAALPTAGGGYSFARCAMGPWGGYLTGVAILLEYAIAPAAIVIFIGAYIEEFTGLNGPGVYAFFYAVFIGIHLIGVGEALKMMMAITLIALFALVAFVVGMIPYFDPQNLFDMVPDADAHGASRFLPNGYHGIWAALPFAMWLFLAVEGVPLAAEEARNPQRDIPRGIIVAIVVLLILAALVLCLGPGGAGASLVGQHKAPLVGALHAVRGEDSRIADFVNIAALAGLIASFFSIIFAYSRQVFALSRAGYLPRFLSVTNRRKVPYLALVIPGVFGFLLSCTGHGDLMITMAVVGAALSYALMTLSHILLRIRSPELRRPYRTPGGILTSSTALGLSLVALASTFVFSLAAALWAGIFYAVLVAYFALYSRHRLVAQAPEEEFSVLYRVENEVA